MNVEIVSIGTEILLGEIVDTNANHIARTLRDIGVNLYYITVVGDNLERITQRVQEGLRRSDLVITTGGLGPTVDDVTRQGVAAATGRNLEFKPVLLDQIADRFAAFGVRMSENNRQQAFVPEGAIVLENEIGTAPCFIVEHNDSAVVCLPGVPREMKHILAQHVIPYLRQKMGETRIIKALVLKTAGIGESHLDEYIADLMTNANPTVGLAAHTGQTDIRITALAETELEADQLIAEMEQVVRERVGSYIYGTGKYPLEKAFVALLKQQQYAVVVFEAGTARGLAQRILSVEGSAAVVAKTDAVSEADTLLTQNGYATLAEALVGKAQTERLLSNQIFIGIATMHGATAITVVTNDKTLSRSYSFGGASSQVAEWAPTWGMSMAWRLLKETELQQNG